MNFGARPDQPGAWLECDVQRVYRGLLGSVRYGRVGAIRSNQLHGVAQPAPVLLALLIVCRDYCCGYCQVCQFLEFANSVRVGRDRQGSVFCRNGMIRARNRDDLRFAALLFRRQFRRGISWSRFQRSARLILLPGNHLHFQNDIRHGRRPRPNGAGALFV